MNLILAAALAALAAFAPQDRKEEKKRARLKAGDAAPEFTVKDHEGKERTLASFRGEKKDRIVVVNFWSHACPWSRAWDGELSKIAREYASKNVLVVSIDSNKEGHTDGTNTDSSADIARYRKEHDLAFEVFRDSEARVADAFGGETTPDVFVIGTDGKIAYTGQIDDMKNPGEAGRAEKRFLRAALDAVGAGKAPETATTSPKGCTIKRARKAQS
jgi:peroxiredoxin